MNNTQQEEAERLARAFVDNHPYPYSASPRLYLNKGFVKGYLSALPKAEVVEKMGKEILRSDKPWPLENVLGQLIKAAEILLHKKDYDGDNWEEISICVGIAKEIQHTLNPTTPNGDK